MELFELSPDDTLAGVIEARHRWGLPGIKCDLCGATWANIGVAYPAADLSTLTDAEGYAAQWPVSWDEFVAKRDAVLPLLPRGAIAEPGTALGPLVGTAEGEFADVVWQNPWTLLLRSDVLPMLQKDLGSLVFGTASLEGQGPHELAELQLEPRGRIVDSRVLAPPCGKCGRQAISRPARLVIDRSSLPANRDLFRLADLTTVIVATERAIGVFRSLGLRGFRYERLALSP